MQKILIAGLLCVAAIPSGFAQTTPQQNTVTTSQAGRATQTTTVKASAVIIGIDKSARKLTLQRANGEKFDVVAGSEVRNFDQIKVKDEVQIEYARSVSLTLQKVRTGDTGAKVDMAGVRAEKGEAPGAAVASSVSIVAEVTNVDPANKTITLKGPQGGVVELDVQNPDQFKVVKQGDQVLVVYTEAMAIAVKPAAQAAK